MQVGNDGPAYEALQESCNSGEEYLKENYRSMGSPRNVLFFMAGVYLCRGEKGQARVYYERARSEYGPDWLNGLAPEGRANCDLYKSVASVLEQAPRQGFPCPDGTAPEYRYGPGGEVDNPLTFDVDESLGTEETNPTPSSEATATSEPSAATP